MFIGLGIFIAIAVACYEYVNAPFPNPYVNKQYGFSINYPNGWQGSENPKIHTLTRNYTVAVVFSNAKGGMFIVKWPLNNQTFDAFVTSELEHIRTLAPSKSNLDLPPPTKTQVNGYPAYYGESHFSGSGGNTSNYYYYIGDGSSAFDITLACVDTNCPDLRTQFDDSVNTIKFES